MSKVVVIVLVLIVAAVAAYYLLGSKTALPLVPASYNSTTSAQPVSYNGDALEDEVNAINLSTDETSDLDLTAIDEDIKGL